MTNEQKLLKLLQIAVENGWDCNKFHKSLQKWIVNKNVKAMFNNKNSCIIIFEHTAKHISLNDLVIDWKKGEVSFIEALFIEMSKKDIKDFIETPQKYTKSFKFVWVDTPTSQRLDWLFETFNHLIQ